MSGPSFDNGFKPKRYDPEPPEDKGCSKCEWLPWEVIVWLITGALAIGLVAQILSNLTAPAQ